MKTESIAFAVAGMLFGVIVGWIIGTQQAGRPSLRSQPAVQEQTEGGAQTRQAPVLDQARVQALENVIRTDPKNVDASTDLGISYYYANQADRALQQFDYSLKLDPKHTKTLLNQGIVRAFGKKDLSGATAAWQRLIEVAPESPEAQAAKRALDTMKSAHPGGAGTSPSGP